MESFDLNGAQQASAEGRLVEWMVALLRQEPGANRSLAAIVKGQAPILSPPVQIPLGPLEVIAGPGPAFKYPKDPAQWGAEIAPLIEMPQEALPPVLVRRKEGILHLSDGNHRVDAWRQRGETHGWAIVWEDRDPRFSGWWGPFLPEQTPEIVVLESAGDFLPNVESEGLVMAARVGDRIVGAVRLVSEFGALTLRTMKVAPDYQGRRLGVRILHHLRPHMEGQVVYCLAFPWLERFYGEFGFHAIAPEDMPEGLRTRFEGYRDEKGCVALRRGPQT